jgi:hypothetical protein
MNTNAKSKKLALARETLVSLDDDQLAKVAGGDGGRMTLQKSCFLQVCTTQPEP